MLAIPIKNTNDKYTASEFTSWNQDTQNAILSTGIVLSGGNLFQLAESMAVYAASGTFYTDSGAANAYVLSPIGTLQQPVALINGMEIRFVAANANTGASTVKVGGLAVKNIKSEDGSTLQSGQLKTGIAVTLHFDTAFDEFRLLSGVHKSEIAGEMGQLKITATTTSATVQPITARDSTNTLDILLDSAITKNLNAAFAAGTGNGGRAAGVSLTTATPYHVFLVTNTATGTVDMGFDTSITATNLLASGAGFTHFRRLWLVHTQATPATTNIIAFAQYGDACIFNDRQDLGNFTTGVVTPNFTSDITVLGGTNLADLTGIFQVTGGTTSVGGGGQLVFHFSPFGLSDELFAVGIGILPSTPLFLSGGLRIPIGLSGGVPTMRAHLRNNAGGSMNGNFFMLQVGWIDNRDIN